jgi:hypothetical protein
MRDSTFSDTETHGMSLAGTGSVDCFDSNIPFAWGLRVVVLHLTNLASQGPGLLSSEEDMQQG